MMTGKYSFSLDRHEAKLLGVCSGLGKRFGIDPTLIRVGWIAVPLLTPIDFSTAVVAYAIAGIVGFVGRKRRDSKSERLSDFERMDQVGKSRPATVHAMRTELDPIDRRLMAIDDHLASPNHELAREIEALKEDK
jgi:phage shock protein C